MDTLSPRLEKHHLDTDFVVIGGGMAGINAALAAARNGARTVLIQDRSVLGGNASSEIKMHIVGADEHGQRPGARETGIIEELRLEDAVRNPTRCYSQWDLLLYEKVKKEPLITLLLDTALIGCTMEADSQTIKAVTALRNSTEDLFEIQAPLFADCSGDGRLGAEAGADYQVGRESRTDFGEPMAPEKSEGHTLGSSILITAKKHNAPQPFIAPDWIRPFCKEELKHRPIDCFEYGYWWFEWGGQHDTIKDNEMIRHELLRIALGIWDTIKNSGDYPESAHWTLDWVGAIPGKRESRRLLGPHILTQHDVADGKLFSDAVAYGGWMIDIHPTHGVDAPDEPPCTQTHLKHLFSIPLRSLHSRNISNLFFAGRNISATHVAFASTRVMATCSVMGQAIGTAAAQAVQTQTGIAKLDIDQLQQQLLKDDAFIPNLKNRDPNDLARTARITASSNAENRMADRLQDGLARDLIGEFGDWADQQPHHWSSTELPATLELTWPTPQTIREIHLTFDSGLQRELILSASDHVTQRVVRGPQPELIKSYRILSGSTCIASEENNFLRKRVHPLDTPITTDHLTLEFLSTHGIDHARIFEIRVYA